MEIKNRFKGNSFVVTTETWIVFHPGDMTWFNMYRSLIISS
jgi:hypothetical protein